MPTELTIHTYPWVTTDARDLLAERDALKADLAEAVALLRRFEGEHHPECTHHECSRRRMVHVFLAEVAAQPEEKSNADH